MYLDILREINAYDIKEFDEPVFKVPVPESEIYQFVKESRMALQYTPCDEYLDLLRLTNGFEWEHMIYGTVEFIESNIEHRKTCDDNTIIIFSSVGNMNIYTYNTKTKTYHIANMSCSTDENNYTYETFGELIIGIFKVALEEQLDD